MLYTLMHFNSLFQPILIKTSVDFIYLVSYTYFTQIEQLVQEIISLNPCSEGQSNMLNTILKCSTWAVTTLHCNDRG